MAIKESVLVANARLSAIAAQVGTGGILEIWSGAQAAAASGGCAGTKLVSMALPSTPFAAPAAGVMAKAGTWQGSGLAPGNAASYAIKDSAGNYHLTGTITASGGGGDMTVDNVSIATNQSVTVTGYQLGDGNTPG